MTMGHTTILNNSGRQIVVSNCVPMSQVVIKLTA